MSNIDDSVNPVAVVLGATGGIGQSLTQILSKQGYRLVLLGRSEESLVRLAAEVSGVGRMVDARNYDATLRVFDEILDTEGRIDAVANCVGRTILKPSHRTTGDDWHDLVETNLTSAFATVSGAARCMKGAGSVVLVSSVAARIGLANHEAISAAKAGIIGLVQSAAATYASRGLRFNAVAPGLVRTPMTADITGNQRALEISTAMHPLGRIGEPDEIARTMAWLLGEDSSWVTGQVFSIDGGMSTVVSKPKISTRPVSQTN